MKLTRDEWAELHQLRWLQCYCLDSWMANMHILDALRPSIVTLGERQGELLALMEAGEVGEDEAARMQLAAMREWREQYQGWYQRYLVEGKKRGIWN